MGCPPGFVYGLTFMWLLLDLQITTTGQYVRVSDNGTCYDCYGSNKYIKNNGDGEPTNIVITGTIMALKLVTITNETGMTMMIAGLISAPRYTDSYSNAKGLIRVFNR